MTNALELLNYGIILTYGALLSADFSGIKKTTKNQRAKFIFICAMFLAQYVCWILFGMEATKKIYPFIVHFPLAFFLILYFHRNWIIAFVSVFSAYLCCQTPRWFATVALYLFETKITYHIVYTLTILITLYLLKKYVVFPVNRLMNLSKRSLLLFSGVPTMYYLFDYTTTVYTRLLYNGIEMAVHFMPSIVSMFYFIFVILYYSEMQKRNNAEKESILMAVQVNQSQKEFATFRELQEKASIYRHDMRHHLALIEGYLTDGAIQKAMDYIHHTQSDIDSITPVNYCRNNTVNLIFSSFTARANAAGVTLSIDVNVPPDLKLSETDLCTLLSNGLENAINAAAQTEADLLRIVRVNCTTNKENLLIFIENYYTGEVVFENGLPQSQNPNHGFGVKSMAMIVERYRGYYSFVAKDGIFTLKIVLP